MKISLTVDDETAVGPDYLWIEILLGFMTKHRRIAAIELMRRWYPQEKQDQEIRKDNLETEEI